MVSKLLESKCTDLHPPLLPFFVFLDFYPHEISTSHTEKVSQFGAGKSSILATNSEWANSFQKPKDVMCIRASNTFSYVKKWHVCWGALSVNTLGDLIFLNFIF